MNVNKLFPSKWLKAADLDGRRVTVTIERVVMETMEGKQGRHEEPVVYFRGAKKALILNQTNAFAIAAAYGPETDGWPGQVVELYAVRIKVKGELREAIRVAVNGTTGPPSPEGDLDETLWEQNG